MISAYNIMRNTMPLNCDRYNPDNVFKRFKVIEFPISFVGLNSSNILDVETDLTRSAYLKTMVNNKLMKFEDAREVSASHRAFNISLFNKQAIEINFTPSNECISKIKHNIQFDKKFVFDLRLIQVDGTRCCNNEFHSEIGRYYICGEFEYCTLTHQPSVIDFGEVVINNRITKYLRIRNGSQITAKMKYVKVTGVEVAPQIFVIRPNSSIRLSITLKPTCLIAINTINFQIRNPYDISTEINTTDDNFLTYTVNLKTQVLCKVQNVKPIAMESLHKLYEPNSRETYLNEELTAHLQRKKIGQEYLLISKLQLKRKTAVNKVYRLYSNKCVLNYDSKELQKRGSNFCKQIPERLNTYGLINVSFLPFHIDFGRVGLSTYGEKDLIIKNNSKYHITIQLKEDRCVLYSVEKMKFLTLKLKPMSDTEVKLFCWGCIEGNYKGTFEYTIDNKYHRKHPYRLQVGNPTLMILDKSIKFGMVTTESFITSVPIRIYNNFNVDINFKWDDIHIDTPFEIIPDAGVVPKHMCKICDVIYVCKPTKTKTHEIDLIIESKLHKIIPVELSVITRKLSIKFLQPAVIFKDIALNIETIEKVKLENSSREVALFQVMEPLIPGLRIKPMSGTIRPKMIMVFDIIVKISCILEFATDIYVKINNKENVILPVSGNIVEPKLLIHPKHIYMARVPCNMVTFVPITFHNISTLKAYVEIMDTGDENMFNVYIAHGNEKERVYEFEIDGGHTKTLFIKVYDIFRREYEMFIPFIVNGILGPPNSNSWSTEIQHYIGQHEISYENNPRVKLKTVNKDIPYCRMCGVITVPWIHFSQDRFEINYKPNADNTIIFTMTNVSKYYLFVSIMTSKLAPNFSLDIYIDENQSIINETIIKFELDRQRKATFTLKFQPKGHGKFASTALLYLDKHMALPYYNLTFIGKRQPPSLTPSTYRIIFPPCHVDQEISRSIKLTFEDVSEKNMFTCMSKEEPNLTVEFINYQVFEEEEKCYTIITVNISVKCQLTYARNISLIFNHDCGSFCDVEVSFCFTYCPLTLHTVNLVTKEDNPYPYFPLESQAGLYDYYDKTCKFLEKWMFQQGFRRDLYPLIPDTFHVISTAIASPSSATKSKGINVSFLNFMRRISGPLMKHVRKITVTGVDEPFKYVKEVHDTYKEVINLLRSRGANVWVLQPTFLLSFEQFAIYAANVTPKCNADILLNQELLKDIDLFNRLNKQSWLDLILQSYKVFIMDSCFFECVCVSSQDKNIIKVLIDWYNEQIALQHSNLRKNKPKKIVTNLTTDLSDGIAIASSILNYCSFLDEHFLIFHDIDECDKKGGIINNGCLIIEAMNILKLYFPLNSVDFLQPNFIQMLFLSVHLYVALPMFKPKDVIEFNPPLLRSSTRQVAISAASQESLVFNYVIINNSSNNFVVEKAPVDNGKKMFLNVKFIANFTSEDRCILLVHGYNKTRIFDTYMTFVLHGHAGSLNPVRKCKVTGPLYRPNKVDVLVSSPFFTSATFQMVLTDIEPTIPVKFGDQARPSFYLRRLNLIDHEITLSGLPKDSGQEVQEHKLYLQMICLSTQIGNSWVWFRSELGEFFIKVTSQPRWDLAIDSLQANLQTFPIVPCSCGEACECYRTTVLVVPHRNDLILKSLRNALLEYASDIMMEVYDNLIETTTGKMILSMLLDEAGTNMTEVHHILRSENVYSITSRGFLPRLDKVKLSQHTGAMLALPITLPALEQSEKYSVTFTSECGMDIRTYRVFFIESSDAA